MCPTTTPDDPRTAPAGEPCWREPALNGHYFGVLGEGMENDGAAELRELGAEQIKTAYRGVHFQADMTALYRILYRTRLCSRILAPILRFDCHSPRYLYRRVQQIPWHTLMHCDQTLAVQAVTIHSAIHHSRYAALTVKDALADYFRAREGRRPSVDARQPDMALHLYIERNQATLSMDLAGDSLHRRGYRTASVDAPMQETLAAVIIRATGWSGTEKLEDPMCGSGTLLCEAWMRACNIPAGYGRTHYALFNLPGFDETQWSRMRREQDAAIAIPQGIDVRGSDLSASAVEAARCNASHLPGGEHIEIQQRDIRDAPGGAHTIVITNPPYGVRLGNARQAEDVLTTFGNGLKQRYAESTAYCYFGDVERIKSMGLKPTWKKPLRNGGLDGLLCKYLLFKGLSDRKGRPAAKQP